MPLSMVEEICVQVSRMDTLVSPTGFCALGEPLMHPDYAAAFRLVKRYGIRWALGTNCQDLRDAVEVLIETCPEMVVMSVDGMSQESIDQIRPGLSYERIRHGAVLLIDAIKRFGSSIVPWVQMIATHANRADWLALIDDYTDRMRGIDGACVYIKRCCRMVGAEMPPRVYPSPPLGVARQAAAEATERTGVRVIVDELDSPWILSSKSRPLCGIGNVFMMVHSDGECGSCCSDVNGELTYGNMKDKTLLELFFSKRAEMFRDMLCRNDSPTRENIPAMCARCITWEVEEQCLEKETFQGTDETVTST